MAKKPLIVTIDEDLLLDLKSRANKGEFSNYIETLLRDSINKEVSSKDNFSELLKIVKQMNDDRKNGLIVFKEM